MAGTANAATAAPAPSAVHETIPADVWDNIAQCESGGKWNTDTGNGYSGGLQFSPSTWRAHGGHGDPSDASPAEQKRVARKVQQSQGWGAWPNCAQGGGGGKSSSGDSSDEGSSGSGSSSDDDED